MKTKRRKTIRKRTRRCNKKKSKTLRCMKGGSSTNNDYISCCMCNNKFNRESMFSPLVCLNKYNKRAHRICSECWWNKFAKEDVKHTCPGCVRGLPLNPPPIEKYPSIVFDLT